MRITPEYIDTYAHIILEQPLKNDKYLREEYKRNGRNWERFYTSNSSYHLCPFDGSFRECKTCGLGSEDFSTEYCSAKQEQITSQELVNRIGLCKKAGLQVIMY